MKIGDLPEAALERVVESNRFINVEEIEWWEDAFEECKEIGKLMGVDIDKIYFSGFSSQGDGACFEGNYKYRKQSVSLIFGHAPMDEELHMVARDLQELQRKYFYQLSARVVHQGHYYHENCTRINVETNEDFSYVVSSEAEDGIAEYLRDFMRWIYHYLEATYEHLTSDEEVKTALESNEYEFDIEGNEL